MSGTHRTYQRHAATKKQHNTYCLQADWPGWRACQFFSFEKAYLIVRRRLILWWRWLWTAFGGWWWIRGSSIFLHVLRRNTQILRSSWEKQRELRALNRDQMCSIVCLRELPTRQVPQSFCRRASHLLVLKQEAKMRCSFQILLKPW